MKGISAVRLALLADRMSTWQIGGAIASEHDNYLLLLIHRKYDWRLWIGSEPDATMIQRIRRIGLEPGTTYGRAQL